MLKKYTTFARRVGGGGATPLPWGYLLPLRDGPPPLELRHDTATAGTGHTCTLHVDPAQIGQPAERPPQVLFEVRRDLLGGKAMLRSEVCVLRIDRRTEISPGQWASVEHGACIAFAEDEQSYVYVNREQSESFGAPPTVLAEYLVGHFLGSGGFGKVYSLFDKDKLQRKAMKIVEPTNVRHVPYAEREARILKSLDHPCVIKTISVEHLNHQHFLIMEYMAGGDLRQFVNEQHLLSEQQTKLVFFQLVLAVEYLHERDICHRDLKPANILLQERRPNTLIKVTDFGLAKCGNDDSSMSTFVGTKPFVAPEIIYGDKYTISVDVWSMGVILYYSLTGALPFASLNDALHRKHAVKYDPNHWQHVSSSALQLVRKMLQVDVSDRVTVSQVIEDIWLRDDALREDVFRLTGLEKYRPNMGDLGHCQSPWGYLLPLMENCSVLELIEEQVTVGTSDKCTLRLDTAKFPRASTFCSLTHDNHNKKVFLTSESNCMFLNGRIILWGWKVHLEHGMKLSFWDVKNAYVYVNRKVSNSIEVTQRYEKEYWMLATMSEGNIEKENEYILLEKKHDCQEKILKVIQVSPAYTMKFEWKAKRILNLKHPCLVEIFSCERLQLDRFLIMDYMGGGDLSEFVNSQRLLTEAQTKLIFFQLILAVEYLHKRNITYRFLNLHNILLKDHNPHTLIKVSTFVLLNDINEDLSTQKFDDLHTNVFIAPDEGNPFAKEVDVYSAGMILLYSLTGYLPSKNIPANWRGVSEEARTLAAVMCHQEPSDRPSLSAVLQDSWLLDKAMRENVYRLTGLEDVRQHLSPALPPVPTPTPIPISVPLRDPDYELDRCCPLLCFFTFSW